MFTTEITETTEGKTEKDKKQDGSRWARTLR